MKQYDPAEAADAIYDILVKICGAYDDEHIRTSFRDFIAKDQGPEFRFQGKLGFGGKFWANSGKWYVNCYGEDANPARNKIIAKADAALADLLKTYSQ